MHVRLILLATLSLVACRPDSATPPAPSVAASRSKTLDPSRELSPLVARLRYEASHRVPTDVTSDKALDALDANGLKLATRQQFLGVTVHASYCLGGKTVDGVAIAACEYPTPTAAAAGKAFMDTRFAAMSPTARRTIRASTVLTIADSSDGTDSARVTRAFDAFAAL